MLVTSARPSWGVPPALLAIDLFELVYSGGPHFPHEIAKEYPNACGRYAYEAIEPTKRLFAAARGAGLTVFYSTGDGPGCFADQDSIPNLSMAATG